MCKPEIYNIRKRKRAEKELKTGERKRVKLAARPSLKCMPALRSVEISPLDDVEKPTRDAFVRERRPVSMHSHMLSGP